jgi:hypothetical protein
MDWPPRNVERDLAELPVSPGGGLARPVVVTEVELVGAPVPRMVCS